MDRKQAAVFLGISPTMLSALSPDIHPTLSFVRLRPGGEKYWTEDGLRAAINRLYLDQVPRHLLPRHLLEAA